MNQLEDNKNAGKIIGVIIGIAIIVMIIYAANRSSHVSYASEDEMRFGFIGLITVAHYGQWKSMMIHLCGIIIAMMRG